MAGDLFLPPVPFHLIFLQKEWKHPDWRSLDSSVFTLPSDQVKNVNVAFETMVSAPQVGGGNEKLADLLAGVAGHLCQVTCFNPSISFVKLCKELYN